MRLHCLLNLTRAGPLAVLISLATIAMVAAREDDRERRDAVRHAVEAGDALPLSQILPKVRDKVAGDVIGVDIERERGRWSYEFRIIGRDGRVLEVHVDARSGEIERIEEK